MITFSSWSDSVAFADLLIRVTSVFLLSLVLGTVLQRRTARLRHSLWTTTFGVLLVLPVLAGVGVAWDLPVLPSTDISVESEAGMVANADHANVNADPTHPLALEGATAARFPAIAPNSAQGIGATGQRPWFPSGNLIVLMIWALGSGASLLSLIVAHSRTRRLIRSAQPVVDLGWQRRLADAQHRVGSTRPVRLLMSSFVGTPMTAGLRRPVIVLPKRASEWSAERRDVVLAHELVHVRRLDTARQFLGSVVCALYWFHPLSWLAARMSVAAREQACDETVLDLGTRPSRYAGHLLEIARDVHTRRPLTALPMVQPSQLEKRIMAILHPTRPRWSALLTLLTINGVVATGVFAATVQPTPLSKQSATRPAQEADVVQPVQPVQPIQPAQPADPTAVLNLMQEMTCKLEGVRGSFSGSFSTSGDRAEMFGIHNGDRVVQKYMDDGLRLCMRVRGDVVMADDGRSVRAMGSDSWMVIETEDDALHRLVITEGSGGIEYAWSIDGSARTYDAEARSWTDRMFAILEGYGEAAQIRGEQSKLRGRISSHRGQVSSMRGEISSLRGQVSSMRGEISTHRGRAGTVRGQISSLRGEVSSLNGRISSHRGSISSLRSALRATDDSGTEERLEREIAEHQRAIEETQREIEEFDLDARVQEKQRELERLEVERHVAEIEDRIVDFDLDERVATIEARIQDFDLDGKVRELERQIEELNADERAAQVERDLRPQIDALRESLRRLR